MSSPVEENKGEGSLGEATPILEKGAMDTQPGDEGEAPSESPAKEDVSKKRKMPTPASSEGGSDGEGEDASAAKAAVDEDNQYDMADGFMVGDDDDDTDGRKSRKKTRTKVERKRLRKNVDKVVLDEDDLAIMEENTQEEEEENGEVDAGDAEENIDDGSDGGDDFISPDMQRTDGMPQDDDAEMDDFIVDVGSDEEGDGGEGIDTATTAAPTAIIPARRAVSQHFVGPTSDEVQESMDIFGIEDLNDLDLDEMDYDVEREGGDDGTGGASALATNAEAKLSDAARQKIERQTLVNNFYTEKDEALRSTDFPERMYHIIHGRSVPDDEERAREADWISVKLAGMMVTEQKSNAYSVSLDTLQQSLVEPIKSVLLLMQVENMEVPFIWAYRKDYLHDQMKRKHLWYIMSLDERWEATFSLQSKVLSEIDMLGDFYRFANGAALDTEQETRHVKIMELRKSREESQEKTAALKLECNATMDTIDQGELDDTELAINKEKVSALQEDIAAEEAAFENYGKNLDQESAEFEKIRGVGEQIAQYRLDGIKDVLKLFPRDRLYMIVEQCFEEQELKDVRNYLDVLLRGALKDRAELPGKVDMEGTPVPAGTQKLLRKAALGGQGKDTTYRLHRKNPRLRELIDQTFVAAPEMGDSMRHGFPVQVPLMKMEELDAALQSVCDFEEETSLLTKDDVENAMILMVITEVAAEPSVRRAIRNQYRSVLTVSTRPTAKALNEITPFDANFGLLYLDDVPAKDFLSGSANASMYAKILQLEHDGHLTVSMCKPLCAQDSYADIEDTNSLFSRTFGELFPFFVSQESAPDMMDSLQRLNGFRLKAMIKCCNEHLLPSLEQEVRRDLTRFARETIVEEAADKFSALLHQGPYRPPMLDQRDAIKDQLVSCPRRPLYATVVAIYLGSNPRSPISMVYCDKDGVLMASDLIPARAASRKVEMLSAFVKSNRPDVIVVNAGGGRASKSTVSLFEKTLLNEIKDSIKEEAAERRNAVDDYYGADDDDEDAYDPKVMLVKDELPEIFKRSVRAKRMFPEFDPSLCAAVCLARYVQEPLAEYCNLWTSANSTGEFGVEALFLKLHPLLHMTRALKSTLLNKLQQRLVDAVCDVGVDINVVVSHEHLSSMLSFVGGLGLRKANHLRSAIREKLKHVNNRKELLERKILKKNVWMNASGFLRVDVNINESNTMDPFDNTRIHPECYYINEWAPKICADSLEEEWSSSLDYGDIVTKLMKDCKKVLERRLGKSKAWVDLWRHGRPISGKTKYKETVKNEQGLFVEKEFDCELNDAVSLLLIEDYCKELETQGQGKHRLQFEGIKDELRFPWLDLRQPLEGPSMSEMFTILTGESVGSLHVGMKVGCVVTRVEDKEVFDSRTNTSRRQQRAQVMIDSGMKGYISMFEVSDDRLDENRFSMREALPEGSKVMAVIMSVNIERQLVDLSIKPSYLAASESWWVRKRHENHHCRRWFEEVAKRGPVERIFPASFNEDAALRAYDSNLDADKESTMQVAEEQDFSNVTGMVKGTKAVMQRHVHHPLFINCSGKEAEERLRANQGGFGSVVIRPSSKGPDSLAITWGFQSNWFMHFEVEEKGKTPGALGLGKELYIKYANLTEPYSDLDEIFARFVDPMNDYVSLMISHRNFREGSVEEVENYLFDQLRERPHNIPYCLRFEPSFAGCFVLTWIGNPNSKNPVKKSRIQVMPSGYFMEKRYFSRPGEIISYLKKHTDRTASRPLVQDAPTEAKGAGAGRRSRFSKQD